MKVRLAKAQWSPPPTELQLARPTQAEFVICDYTIEKGFRTLKGPIRMRPVFLHKDERIEALMWVNMLALLTYSILGMKCRRQGLTVGGEKVLKGFAYLVAIYTRFVDGSLQLQVEELNTFQQDVVKAPGQSWWPALLGRSWPALPERQVILRPRWEKIPIPLLMS